ncbi:MAG: tail fiber domain-containing protein [Candidatus Ochrobactrum gambitense]|nr:MAG: tail fiber domain-containing protein [Candidatus Ochrobactrum gambitense]WEK15806.1 MAG: tail fiber domain-containing protein [Candidatus Ochrobactrum gambitense]
MANTPNYGWPTPNPNGIQITEIQKIAMALTAADQKVKSVETALSTHKHSFSDLENLPDTLAGYGITDGTTVDEMTAAIQQLKNDLVNGSGPALDTLKELADALGNDPNFASTVGTALGFRVRVDAAQGFTLAQKAQARTNIDALGTADKGVANGVMPLGSDGKALPAYMPEMNYLSSAGGTVTGGLRVNSAAGIIVDAETGLRLRSDGTKQVVFQAADGSANRGFIAGYENGVINVITAVGTSRTFTFNPNGQFYLPVTSTDSTSAVRRDDMLARITEVNSSIAGKATRDWISAVGLVGNNPGMPYVKQESTGNIITLQPSLGFTAARQLGGNQVGFQWTGGGLNINIDNGGYSAQIVDSNNFLAWLNNQAVMRQNNYNYTLGAGAGAGAGQVCLIANMNSSGDALSVRDRGGEKGSVRMTTTATQFNTSSDYRLKSDVAPLVSFTLTSEQFDALDTNLLRIMLLRPVSYRWNVEPDQIAHGFIAHEMQEVMPHAVSGQKDAVKRLGRATVRGPLIAPEYVTGDVVKEVQSAVYGPSIVYEDVKIDDYPGADWEYTHTVPDYQQIDNSKVVADLTAAVQSLTLMVLDQRGQIADLQANFPSGEGVTLQ